jgi:hypothetical protein
VSFQVSLCLSTVSFQLSLSLCVFLCLPRGLTPVLVLVLHFYLAQESEMSKLEKEVAESKLAESARSKVN